MASGKTRDLGGIGDVGDPDVAMLEADQVDQDDEAANEGDNHGSVDAGEEIDEEDEEEVDDPSLKFQNVMAAIDLERLKKHAVEVRLQQCLPETFDRAGLSCRILENPLHGSFNIVYVIEFSDGGKWVARVPIQGTRMEEADVDMLNTDYSTLKYIRKELHIPTPEVYKWETTCDSIGVPFAFMSFVSGESICHRWDDKDWVTEEKRLKILTNLAHVMAKLQRPRFDKIGTLRFDEVGKITHIGPDHLRIEDEERFYTEGVLSTRCVGPYDSVDDWLLDDLDTCDDLRPDTAQRAKGCLEVMKLAIQSIPSYIRLPGHCELDFWDYNYQNILIDDDCNITTIFDWDGIRAVPQGMGCTRYPSWITRDWDPGQYEPPLDGDWVAAGEDPPEKLTQYRKHYADTFAALDLKDYDPRTTKLSHILESITLGIGLRFNRQYIMKVLLNHAYGGPNLMLEEAPDLPWDFQTICRTLGDPSKGAAKAMRKDILKQFETMWHAEWEAPEPRSRKRKRDSQGYRRYLPRLWKSKPDNISTPAQASTSKQDDKAKDHRRSFSRRFMAILKQ